jgi:hypothetical protein
MEQEVLELHELLSAIGIRGSLPTENPTVVAREIRDVVDAVVGGKVLRP